MANEQRLIDANAPLKQLFDYMEKLHCSDDYRDGLYRGMEIAESYIKNAPTVDAVEVVLCGQCGFSDLSMSVLCAYICKNPKSPCRNRVTFADFGCLYGERREENG